MASYEIDRGTGRARLKLFYRSLGDDILILISNESAHIGAVALGEYDEAHQRASTSVVTRLGHKDDTIAQKAAYQISKVTRRPSCVVAGVHLDNITAAEIKGCLAAAEALVDEFLRRWQEGQTSR